MEHLNKRDLFTIDDFSKVQIKYKADTIDFLQEKNFYNLVKRTFDIIGSIIGIIIFSLPMVIISLLIKKESKGKAIYSQVRLGKNEKPFVLYKFRSMKIDAEEKGVQWAEENDPRVTEIGKILRATRLDELPQLINILKGDMSFVGPRPERPEFYSIFDTYIDGFRQRMLVRPGLTGLAQVIGGYNLLPEEKIVYDVEYINNRSILKDFELIIKTITVVINGDKERNSIKSIKCCEVVSDQSE